MKIELEMAPNEKILRDKKVEITLIGGYGLDEAGKATMQIAYKRTCEVIRNGQVVDTEIKEGNMRIPVLGAEILEDIAGNLPLIQSLLDARPDTQGMEVVSAKIANA